MKVAAGDVLARLIRENSALKAQPDKNIPGSPGDFSRLLEEMAKNVAAGQGAGIDKDKLTVMLEFIKNQMSQSVMNSFSGNEGEDFSADYSFMPGTPQVQGSQQEESKDRQSEPTARSVLPPADLDAIIDKASATYGVDKGLITSVIRAESDFHADATSPKGAMGLMQLMPDTARGLGVSDAYDPEQNVMAGTRYLKGLLQRYDGDVRLALAAYNWGMGNLERSTGNLPQETRNYIARIMKSYGRTQA